MRATWTISKREIDMTRQFGLVLSLALFAYVGNAAAEPEMRCRIDGAYIKVYGKNEGEQRTVCEQQGGEMTRYDPREQQHPQNEQGNQTAKGMRSIMGR